ncbi:Kaptin, actin binding protein [Balamuthia mandrillaris]
MALDVMVDAATGQLQLGVAILQDEMPFLSIHICALKPCHLLSSDDIQKQTFSLDYIPFVLTHVRLTSPKPLRTSGSNSRRGSFTNVSSQQQPSPQEEGTTDAFLLSGSDNEIYAFVNQKHTNEQGADMFVSQPAQDILPELANQELSSPVMCFDIYQGTWGRIVAGGCQDGKLFVHATLPASGAESEEEKRKNSSLQRVFHYKRLWDGPITSVRLFFSLDDRKTVTEEDEASSSVGLVLSPNPSKKDAEAPHVHPFFRSLHQRVNQFLSFEDIDDDSSPPPEYTQVHLLVTSAIGPSMVYHHVALNGLYSETISVLPLSGDHDSVLCSQVAVLDWNNPFSSSPLLLLGTYGQELLVYRFHCTGNEASEEERGGSKYALMWKRSFSNAIYGLDCADLTRDGMMEVAVRSGDGVHVLQHDPALACQRILSRLSFLKGLIDLQESFHHDLLS